MRARRSPTRRAVLAGAAAAVLAGCTRGGPSSPVGPGGSQSPSRVPASAPGSSTPPPVVDADAALRADAADDLHALGRRYRSAAATVPALDGRLAAVQAELDAQLRALGAPALPDRSASTPRPARTAEPADRARARAGLASAERAATARRVDGCDRALDAGLARLLAAVGAAGASRAVLLVAS